VGSSPPQKETNMFELISCIYDDVSQETIVLVNTDTGRKHFLRDDPEKELYDLVQAYQEDFSPEKLNSLQLALSPKQAIVEQFSQIDDDSFSFRNGRAYLNGTNVPVPEAIAHQLNLYVEQGVSIESLINFWTLCLLNPNVDARNRLFEYVMTYGATLTPDGRIFLYKSVKEVQGLDVDERLTLFMEQVDILEEDNVEVWVHNLMNVYALRYPMSDVFPSDASLIGTVGEIRAEIGDVHGLKATYTDWYTQQSTIQLGEPVTMDRSLCDPDINAECSFGHHVGSYRYVRHFHNNQSDAKVLGVLVNPANVVALPLYDNSKIRVCEYFPYVVMTKDENNDWSEIPSVFTEVDYTNHEKVSFKDALITSEIDGQNVHVTQHVVDFYA